MVHRVIASLLGNADAGATQAGPAAQALQAAPAAAQAQSQPVVFTLVLLAALAIVFIVAAIRALPWSDAVKRGMSETLLVFLTTAPIFGLFMSWSSAMWAAVHALPAAGLAMIGLRLLRQ